MNRWTACVSPLLVLAGILAAAAPAAAQQVKWRYDYNAARKEAEDTNRPLIIDFGTENCFWCKKLDQTTFLDSEVAGVMNDRFVPLKIDAAKEASLAGALQIQSYPTIVLASPDGKILERVVGYKEAAEFQLILRRTLASLGAPPPTPTPPPTPAPDPRIELMVKDYQDASRAIAVADYARAIVLLKGILEDGKDRPVQVKARQLLAEIEQQAATRLTRARQLQEEGHLTEGNELAAEVARLYPGTRAATDAAAFLATRTDDREDQRRKRARDLLAQAKEDFRTQQYLCCLDRCELLAANYADLPEGMQAIQLSSEIKSNPEWMRKACDSLSDRLGLLYLSLAETWIRKGDPGQATHYLERVVQAFPNTRQAEAAQIRLSYLKGEPTIQVEFQQQP